MGVEGSALSGNQMQLNHYGDNGMTYDTDMNLFFSSGQTYAEIESYSDLGYNGEC
jgi:hypothetical protein